MINGLPEVLFPTVDLHKHLIPMSLQFGKGSKLLKRISSDLSSEHRLKPVTPVADSFMADVAASLVHEIFDVPKREREKDTRYNREADGLRTCFEALEGGRFRHFQT